MSRVKVLVVVSVVVAVILIVGLGVSLSKSKTQVHDLTTAVAEQKATLEDQQETIDRLNANVLSVTASMDEVTTKYETCREAAIVLGADSFTWAMAGNASIHGDYVEALLYQEDLDVDASKTYAMNCFGGYMIDAAESLGRYTGK